MIIKNGIKCGIVNTTIATALLAISNFSSSSAPIIDNAYVFSSSLTHEHSLDRHSSNSCIDDNSILYYNKYDAKDRLISLFSDSREMTDDELKVYKSILKNGAKKTGLRLF